MPSGGSGGSQTTSSDPWKGVQQYLTGSPGTKTLIPGSTPTGYTGAYVGGGGDAGDSWDPNGGTPIYPDSDYTTTGGTTGIYQAAQNLYGQSGFTPQMQDVVNQWLGSLGGQQQSTQGASTITNTGNNLINGQGSQVNLTDARAAQGALDPTAALQQALSGQVNQPVLDNQIAALGNDLSTNFNQNIAPGLRSGAVAAGGYGGSRQGIAEGLGTQGVTQSLASQAAQLEGNAYNTAQTLQAQTGQALNDQAATVAQNNIANKLNSAQIGAGLISQGTNLNTAVNQANNQTYQQMLQALGTPNQYNWQNLGNYASIIEPGASLGGTSTTSQQQGSNPVAGAAGGALSGAAIGSVVPGIGTAAGAIGGGLVGLIGSL